jgi:CPA2 family monovalent cation:H+ antiporter-2
MITAVTLPFLNEMVALFVISVGIAYLCYRFHLVPIVGFLIAGVIIGPNALGLVQDQELVDILAEIGIILLLFTIGIEFSLEKLNRIRKAIIVGGGLQVFITTGLVTAILFLFDVPWQSGIYTGCLVALSSTAIILGLLSEQGQNDTPYGQLSLAVLIFQDLAIIVMVLLIPLLSGDAASSSALLWVLGRALILIVLVLVLAQRIVPWILEKVAHTRKQELFLLTVVAICFGTAAISSMAGVSLALGAFLAGLVVSESHFSEHALSEILPLRTIFNAVFFVSVGMLLNIQFLIDNPLIIAGTAVAVLFIKFIINTGSLLTLGYPVRIVAASGIALAQIGEFSFVLERAGRAAGLSPAGLGDAGSQIFIAVTVLLMIATPFMVKGGPKMGDILGGTFLQHLGQETTTDNRTSKKILEDHVVIIGYGPAGRHLEQVLHDSGIPYVIIEMNPASVEEMKSKNIPVIYGDASRPHILELAAIKKAKLCVIATNDPRSTPRILKQARFLNPILQLVVRTRYLNEVNSLEQQGADIVVPEEMETTVRLFSHVLGAYMIPQEEINQHIQEVRAHDYEIMRGSIQEAHLMVLQGLDEEGLHTRAVMVRENSYADGKTLQELHLRNEFGITILTIKRDDQAIGNPDGSFKIAVNDRLIMMGNADQFVKCAHLFRPAE